MSDGSKKVYEAINRVQAALAKEGITKNRTASTGGSSYKFRGIDDVFNALSPLLAEHKLCILPRVIDRSVVERASKSGGVLIYTTLMMEFDIVSAEDGSCHTVRTVGEAMDSGDKSCNKAMSAGFKYAAFQTFAIPTEGDNDSENQTHELAPTVTSSPKKTSTKPAPRGAQTVTPEKPADPQHVVDVRKRIESAGCKDKKDGETVISYLLPGKTGDMLRASPEAAKEFCDSFDAALEMHKGKSLLAVARASSGTS